jgi:uncharacterized protein
MNEEIQNIKLNILPILKKYGVIKAGIFGSYARGEQKARSDVDFLIKIKDNASLTDLIALQLALQKKLGKKADIVEYEVIRPELKEKILKEEIKIL